MYKVIDFYADWCAPCKIMSPLFHKVAEEYADKASFESVNVEENGALASQFQVMSIPTFVILIDGQEIARRLGAMPEEVFKSWLDEYLK
jgi:thioredoxin 1